MEGDWTPTKTYLSQLTTYRGGSLIFFQDKNRYFAAGKCRNRIMVQDAKIPCCRDSASFFASLIGQEGAYTDIALKELNHMTQKKP